MIQKGIKPYSWPASTDLSTSQYYPVTFSTLGAEPLNIDLCDSTIGGFCCGVLQNDPDAAGRAAVVQTRAGAITKVMASATATAITIGCGLHASTLGRVMIDSTGGVPYTIGRSKSALASGTQIIEMMITHEGSCSTS